MQEDPNLRRWDGIVAGLCQHLDVPRRQDRRERRRRRRRRVGNGEPRRSARAEVDHPVARVITEPRPGGRRGFAIDRAPPRRGDDGRVAGAQLASAVKAPEALDERREGRTRGDERVEVQVQADLERLGADDEQRRGSACASVTAGDARDQPLAIDRAARPDHQHRVCVIPEALERASCQRHRVRDDADHRGSVACQAPRLAHDRALFRAVGQQRELARGDAPRQCPLPQLLAGKLEAAIRRRVLRGGYRHDARARGAHVRELHACDGASRVQERLGQMSLVEHDQAVGRAQRRRDRPRASRNAVTSKQHPRPDLIDRRADGRACGSRERRSRSVDCDVVRETTPPDPHLDGLAATEPAESRSNLGGRRVARTVKSGAHARGVAVDRVDDAAAINDPEQPPRQPPGRVIGAHRQRKQKAVDERRLAGTRGC